MELETGIKGLVLAAVEVELAGLGSMPLPGWGVALVGIGGLIAAASMARLIADVRPPKVLFVGTCGAYGQSLKIGDCIAVSEAVAISIPEIQHKAYRPKNEIAKWPSTWVLPLPEAVVAATPAITMDLDDAILLAKAASAENLELAGIFAACHQAGVPVAAALAVSNRVGPASHVEWRANHQEVCKALVEMLERLGVFD